MLLVFSSPLTLLQFILASSQQQRCDQLVKLGGGRRFWSGVGIWESMSINRGASGRVFCLVTVLVVHASV